MSESPDWAAIAEAYRAGVLSLREIAVGHGITEGAIRARGKKAGWVRGVTQAVTQPEPGAARLAALEARVEALALVMQEAGELLTDLAALNMGALWERRACKPGCPARFSTRWG